MPSTLPIFPLAGVLLLPGGELPLNIFEPRYIKMVDDALATPSRLIGMVQPKSNTTADTLNIYPIGCAGRITSFTETSDGRYLITLSGLCRFTVEHETTQQTSYRTVSPNWAAHAYDLNPRASAIAVDRARLNTLLHAYFHQQGLSCDWDKVELTGDVDLLTALAMICPLRASEKQAILEAPTIENRTEIFLTMIEMAINQTEPECERTNKCH